VCEPLILQSDMTILFEVNTPLFESVRSRLSSFSELEKSPEYIHTYRITPVSVWNAASSGIPLKDIEIFLQRRCRYELPRNVLFTLRDLYSRFGKLVLTRQGERLLLESSDPVILQEARSNKRIGPFMLEAPSETSVFINSAYRGHLKREFIEIGFPVRDEAGYTAGTPFAFALKDGFFSLRDYQTAAVEAFYEGGADTGGSGTVVLPCGAGKTIVGMGVMSCYQCQTLILTTNIVALRQWRRELIDKTDIDPESIGEYSGEKKEVRPITIATYNIATYRKDKEADFEHFGLFSENNWGLIVYDEVHLLPAPVFRVTAGLQARRRLGLTATLIREDGLETDVFSLIGPRKYDMPWKELENRAWIARALCHEFRIAMDRELRLRYISGGEREKFRLASENSAKEEVVAELLVKHSKDNVLVIGQFIKQLESLAERFRAPIITGSTPTAEREQLYARFRKGETPVLVVSRVANFGIDLPDANVAIQVSGTFGSRQEEAQRLGRILRPKQGANTAFFYTLVTRGSKEQQYASNRQRFLTEQGYAYTMENWGEG